MSSLFFWIIILSFVVPMAMRMYRRSMARRDRDQGLPGQYPGSDQFPGYGQFPGSAGPQSNQPRDGYTQQDYYSGGFRQGQPGQPPQPYQYGQPPTPDPRYGAPQEPPYQQAPYEQQPSQQQRPWQQSPGQQAPGQPSGPATPPPPAAPQGFRARKLAELDQQYSNGELSMEDYMKRRGDIMNG
ncbi:hypothetical protein ACFFGR_11735 [Arthrobacter liuii]|uniref:SHOCT domain-containing protein n=1 Tax=Arthrobacter liuii TaxID=1476996 RepID=A0ABQ2AFY6_9MICC|nr:hypothetical protein [Arthrobacter liuii]GGH89639.1 hypothetical protein GCM10007170_01530 [Arthrobacter liuii]